MKGPLALFDTCAPKASCLPRAYQGPLQRHVDGGDVRLLHLAFHLSPATHDLWNFLMTEEERLKDMRRAGTVIIGALKDLGTLPVLVNAYQQAVAFYPDGAWWLPCFKEQRTELLPVAEALGAGEGLCPVRAMLAAFELGYHFPLCSSVAQARSVMTLRRWRNGLSNADTLFISGRCRMCVKRRPMKSVFGLRVDCGCLSCSVMS
jgi:hypothetical protein